ncbi:MAG: GTP-binding protein [Thermoleophilia bacterium]|nr:GTP-binding protein [Thermoleophilia bacterium]
MLREITRRRTIAVISHPDAGKTTLTERLLAETGVIAKAGQVNAKREGATTTTDWMSLERDRGISVTSSAVRIETETATINLLDTPDHGDFSEDTYRVLSAGDAAIMLLDAPKGIEPQTRRLFEVCRARNTPIITFINKFDRPARDPLEILHEIETELNLVACPFTWPVGDGDRFRALIDLPAVERRMLVPGGIEPNDNEWDAAEAGGELAWEAAGGFDRDAFLAGTSTPVVFGAAAKGWGTDDLLKLVETIAPPPAPLTTVTGDKRPLDAPFAGFVFKLQSNMDPRHRDVSAFLRVCSGHFERGMKVIISRTGSPMVLKQAQEPFGRERNTIEDAWPGDVVVLPNSTSIRIGDTLHAPGSSVAFPHIKSFAPGMFAEIVNRDIARRKQFQKGIDQLTGEGVVQLLVDPRVGIQRPIAPAAGELQFEVFSHRMKDEFGVEVRLDRLPYDSSAQTRAEDLPTIKTWHGVAVYERTDGSPLVLFGSSWALDGRRRTDPEVMLEDVLS